MTVLAFEDFVQAPSQWAFVGNTTASNSVVVNDMKFRAGSPNKIGGGGCGCLTPWSYGIAMPQSISLDDDFDIEVDISHAVTSGEGALWFGFYDPNKIGHYAGNFIGFEMEFDGATRCMIGTYRQQSQGSAWFTNGFPCDGVKRKVNLKWHPNNGVNGQLTFIVAGVTLCTMDVPAWFRTHNAMPTHLGLIPACNKNRDQLKVYIFATTIKVNGTVIYAWDGNAMGDPGWTGSGTYLGNHSTMADTNNDFKYKSSSKSVGGTIFRTSAGQVRHATAGIARLYPATDALELRVSAKLNFPHCNIDSGAGVGFGSAATDAGTYMGPFFGVMFEGGTQQGFCIRPLFRPADAGTTGQQYTVSSPDICMWMGMAYQDIVVRLTPDGHMTLDAPGQGSLEMWIPTAKLAGISFDRVGLEALRHDGGQCLNVEIDNLYYTAGRDYA